jgi:phosphoglycolate phosphatase (TIGR01487 family)
MVTARISALTQSLPDSLPPLAVDIDGTLTDDQRAVDPRVLPVLRAWPSRVVIATGKAAPYPVALCEFLGIEPVVIAENGGVAIVQPTDRIVYEGDPEAVSAVVEAYRAAGHSLGWGTVDLVNRWRETELAVSRDSPLEPLEAVAADHGQEVVDTGFAYHVKSPDISKGRALQTVASELDLPTDQFVAVGDSPNDVSAFETAGTGIAVGNAPDPVKSAADHVTDAGYADGFLQAVEWLCPDE